MNLNSDDLRNKGVKKDIYKIRLSANYVSENDGTETNRSFILFYENDATLNFI